MYQIKPAGQLESLREVKLDIVKMLDNFSTRAVKKQPVTQSQDLVTAFTLIIDSKSR